MKLCLAATLLLLSCILPLRAQEPGKSVSTSAATGLLSPEEIARLMPATVFFQGQTAPIQLRNAAGARLTPKAVVLVALVDTSGYSSSIQARYQAYLITETAVSIDGHALPAGAYGVGFLPNDQFVVMDLGGHDLFLAQSTQDPTLRRPRPLQITLDPAKPTEYRLYEGRSFIPFTQAPVPR